MARGLFLCLLFIFPSSAILLFCIVHLNLTLYIFVVVVFLCAMLEYPPLQTRHPYSPKCDIDIDFETLGDGQTGRSCLMGGPAPSL